MRIALLSILGAIGGCPSPSSDSRTVTAPRFPPEHDVTGPRRDGRVGTLPAPVVGEACYLGEDGMGATCPGLVALVPRPVDYVYPPPLSGSLQYAEPALFLDLTATSPSLMLTPHFALDELAQEWKGAYAVVQPHAVASLQAVRDQVGPIEVNSGYRSPGYNATIGGSASSSRHMYGDGFDLDPVEATLDELHDACWAAGAGYVGVYVSHVHCDWRDDAVDPYFFGLATAAIQEGWLTPRPVNTAAVHQAAGVYSAPAEGWDEGEPLRRWWAFDADGAVVAFAESQTFSPPPQAVELIVNVGLELEIGVALTTAR